MRLGFITHKEIKGITRNIHSLLGTNTNHYCENRQLLYAIVNNKTESESYEKKGYTELTQTAINLAKILEYNKDFNNFILSERVNKHSYSNKLPFLHFDKKDNLPPSTFLECVEEYIYLSKITEKYEINSTLLYQIPIIIKYRCLFLPFLQDITISPEYMAFNDVSKTTKFKQPLNPSSINIKITSANVSIEQIKTFLKNHKDEIYKQFSILPKNEDFYIAAEAYQMLNMRKGDKPIPHKKIAEKFKKEEPAVRQTVSETNKKIKSFFKPKPKT